MKIIKKDIPVIEVKRTFVVADLISSKSDRRKKLGNISKDDFMKKLAIAKKSGLSYPEKKLDKIIGDEFLRRLKAYNKATWSMVEVSVNDLGVWNKAGGLPKKWTDGNLRETANYVKEALETSPKELKKRAKFSIPNIVSNVSSFIQDEDYLLPIAFTSGVGTCGRKKSANKTKYDLDDGCMRSIALTIAGYSRLRIYLGTINK